MTAIRKAFVNLEVLHGVHVEIADGEFIVLVGPSGDRLYLFDAGSGKRIGPD